MKFVYNHVELPSPAIQAGGEQVYELDATSTPRSVLPTVQELLDETMPSPQDHPTDWPLRNG